MTEEELKEAFGAHGSVERAKKLNNYAFVHFTEREDALKVTAAFRLPFSTLILLQAMDALNGSELAGVPIEVTLAKPQMDKAKRERMKLERERRQVFQFSARGGRGGPGAPPFAQPTPMGFAPMPRGGPRGRGGRAAFGLASILAIRQGKGKWVS